MIEVRQTESFRRWLLKLRDRLAQQRIGQRIATLDAATLTAAKSVGDGVSELRFAFGPGYRVYFVRRDQAIIVLLCAGDKDSQARDIKEAKRIARNLD